MSINLAIVEAFEAEIDRKIENARALQKAESSHMAQVKRVDQNGTVWVHIFGGALETPIRNSYVSVSEGDLVNVSIGNGAANIVGSSTSPAASVHYVNQANENLGDAVRAQLVSMLGDIVQIKHAVIDRATINQLLAVDAVVNDLVTNVANINELTAQLARIGDLDAHFAQIDLANVNAANINVAKVKEIFARSGWFDEITVMGDASITGQLKSVLIDGDTARFRNIYADALKILGPDGLYHALNMAGLSESDAAAMISAYGEALEGGLHGSHIIAESVTATEIDVASLNAAMLLAEFVQIGASAGTHIEAQGDRFSFFIGGSGWETIPESYLYTEVENPTGDPSAQGWYELVDEHYVISTDTSVYSFSEVDPEGTENPSEEGWYESDGQGGYSLSSDTVVDSGKTYYERETGAYYYYNVTANTTLPGEVAYIAVDPETQESTFYMTRSVVMRDLRFGKWKWYSRRNDNMALKWVGQ